MAYGDFTLEAIVDQENLQVQDRAIFEVIESLSPTAWLQETLSRSTTLGLFSGTEKAR